MDSTSDPNPPATPTPAPASSLSNEDNRHHVLSLALHHIETPNIAHQVNMLGTRGPTYLQKRTEKGLVDQVRDFLKNPTLVGGTIADVNGLMALLQDPAKVEECDILLKQAVEYDFAALQISKPAQASKLRRAEAKARYEADKEGRWLEVQQGGG